MHHLTYPHERREDGWLNSGCVSVPALGGDGAMPAAHCIPGTCNPLSRLPRKNANAFAGLPTAGEPCYARTREVFRMLVGEGAL